MRTCRHVHEGEKYITPLLAGTAAGRDRRRTDGFRSRSSVLQRERLGNRLPVCL